MTNNQPFDNQFQMFRQMAQQNMRQWEIDREKLRRLVFGEDEGGDSKSD